MHRGSATLRQQPPAQLAGGEILSRGKPSLGHDGAMLDARALPFDPKQVFNSSVASSEVQEILPLTAYSAADTCTVHVPATSTAGQWIDLANSYFTVSATNTPSGHACRALFYSLLMHSEARMWLNGREHSHHSGGQMPFTAFAQALLKYPREQMRLFRNSSGASINPDVFGELGERMWSQGIQTPGAFGADPPPEGAWQSITAARVQSRLEALYDNKVDVRIPLDLLLPIFGANGGPFLPASVDLRFELQKAGSSFRYASCVASGETFTWSNLSARFLCRRVTLTNAGQAVYQQLLGQARLLRYGVQHCRTQHFTIQSGSTSAALQVMTGGRAPMCVVVHLVPSAAVAPSSYSEHRNPYCQDLTSSLANIAKVSEIEVRIAGKRYPEQLAYTRDATLSTKAISGGSVIRDYQAYADMCKAWQEGKLDQQPLFDFGSYTSGDCNVHFLNTQPSQETIQERKQPVTTNSNVELNLTFGSALGANIAAVVTLINAGEITIDPVTGRTANNFS